MKSRLSWPSLLLRLRFSRNAGITAAILCAYLLIRIFSIFGGPASCVSYSRAIYDRNGTLLRLTLSDDQKFRKFVSINKISPVIKETILQREDRFFYFHPGLNPVAFGKATIGYFQGQKRGASTITMQLARLLYRLETRSIHGKAFQILCAFYLEFRYSKSAILEAYLNLIPLGHNVEGVGAASLIYFGKASENLDKTEALTLCVIPPSPAARVRKAERNRTDLPFHAPHFTDMVLSDPEFVSDQEIQTTLHLPFQRAMERTIESYVKTKSSVGIHNAAALLIDVKDNHILAQVGSADFSDRSIQGQVDGTRAKRSPGSALKPMLYAIALDRGIIHPRTVLRDAPIQFSTYTPENFEGEFLGPISAQAALVLSRNVPAIYISSKIRNPDFTDFLKSNGVIFPKPNEYYGLAPILGGIEVTMQDLARFYSALAKSGVIRNISFNSETGSGKSIFSPQAAFLTLEMLRGQKEDGTNEDWIKKPFTVYWKTGTSAGFRDAWTAGIFGGYVLVVWVGNFDGASNPSFIGREAAAPLFFQITTAISSEDANIKDWIQRPPGVNRIEVCSVSGKIPRAFCPTRVNTWYIPGKSPIEPCDVHREILVDADSGLRTCGKSHNVRKEVYEFWPSDIDRLLKTSGIPARTPPRFSPECREQDVRAEAPLITLPVRGVTYTIDRPGDELGLTATVDSSASQLFWFLDDSFMGASKPGEPFFWKARVGRFTVRVVDSIGGSDQTDLIVALSGQ